jgi:hypothetical protein
VGPGSGRPLSENDHYTVRVLDGNAGVMLTDISVVKALVTMEIASNLNGLEDASFSPSSLISNTLAGVLEEVTATCTRRPPS